MAKTKKYSAGEMHQVTCKTKNGELYHITRNSSTKMFFCYKVYDDGSMEKLPFSEKTPQELEKRF